MYRCCSHLILFYPLDVFLPTRLCHETDFVRRTTRERGKVCLAVTSICSRSPSTPNSMATRRARSDNRLIKDSDTALPRTSRAWPACNGYDSSLSPLVKNLMHPLFLHFCACDGASSLTGDMPGRELYKLLAAEDSCLAMNGKCLADPTENP